MKPPGNISAKIWLFTLAMVIAILVVCIFQIHRLVAKLLHSN
jgi:hypothetical protein